MTNLKNEGTKTVVTKIQPFKGWSILLVLVLVATTAGAALAYSSDPKGHTFDDTFTKWVIYLATGHGRACEHGGRCGRRCGSWHIYG